MQEVSAQLSTSMHELRAAELGMTPDQLALQNEIQMAARALAEQGMSPDEISKVLTASLQMREDDIAKSEAETADGKKKKKKNKKKGKKKGGAEQQGGSSDAVGDDEDGDDEDGDETAAPAADAVAQNKWDDVE